MGLTARVHFFVPRIQTGSIDLDLPIGNGSGRSDWMQDDLIRIAVTI